MSDALRKALQTIINVRDRAHFTKADLDAAAEAVAVALSQVNDAPIPMMLWCPQCGTQHVDTPAFPAAHRSHLCHRCGWVWRVCDRTTVGVASLQTKGERDGSPVPPMLLRLIVAGFKLQRALADAQDLDKISTIRPELYAWEKEFNKLTEKAE